MSTFMKLGLFSLILLISGCGQPKTESIQPVPAPTELIRSEGFSTLGPSTSYDLTDVYQRYPYLSGPSYIDEAAVYFYASSEKDSSIFRYSLTDRHLEKLYSTSQTIYKLVGVGRQLFWIRYQDNGKDSNWTLEVMDLATGSLQQLDHGIESSRFYPDLQATTAHVSWIKHISQKDQTRSLVQKYDAATGYVTTQKTLTVKEAETRSGDYAQYLRDGDAGILLDQTTYKADEKTTAYTTLSGKAVKKTTMPFDFAYGQHYLATGAEGSAGFQAHVSNHISYRYKTSEPYYLIDGFCFLTPDHIVFREERNQLLYTDLSNGTVVPLTDQEGEYSKPVFTNGRLGYSVVRDDGSVSFRIIQVNN
ncbi:hypothetical protein HNY42_09430 [Exiguobacterium sp. Helios]|uniref:hypothetical protein n=1 Tax=Exiguobacterium sp. Helios TaxID=2735868 RepID=UPI00165E1827|nr:hypothetical protein [Exiguobacterium sp. Helios]QNR21142.1 hypothetical protein HNY42_09430 [Exiguobacterium sp. Helios]